MVLRIVVRSDGESQNVGQQMEVLQSFLLSQAPEASGPSFHRLRMRQLPGLGSPDTGQRAGGKSPKFFYGFGCCLVDEICWIWLSTNRMFVLIFLIDQLCIFPLESFEFSFVAGKMKENFASASAREQNFQFFWEIN